MEIISEAILIQAIIGITIAAILFWFLTAIKAPQVLMYVYYGVVTIVSIVWLLGLV